MFFGRKNECEIGLGACLVGSLFIFLIPSLRLSMYARRGLTRSSQLTTVEGDLFQKRTLFNCSNDENDYQDYSDTESRETTYRKVNHWLYTASGALSRSCRQLISCIINRAK